MEHLWSQFTTYHLTENMRLIGRGEEERQFADYLLRIGNGTEPAVEEPSSDKSTAETKIAIPSKFLSKATTREDFIKEIFPSLSSIVTQGLESDDNSWHDWLCERAIICPTNADVNKINKAVIQEFPGELQTYKSHDKCLNRDQVDNQYIKLFIYLINSNMCLMNTFQLHAFPVDYLNTIDVNSMPPHLLQLKKGMPIMLIRNLDSTRGHVNGTRYIIRELTKRLIYAEIAVGPYKGKLVLFFP